MLNLRVGGFESGYSKYPRYILIRVLLIVWCWRAGGRSLLAYCKSIWRWKNTLNRYLWQYCSLPRQLLVLLHQPINGQHSHHLTVYPPMGGKDRWLMIILDGSFISIFSLWARLIMWCMSYGDCVGGDRPQHYNRYLSEYQALSSLLSTHSISCNPHS